MFSLRETQIQHLATPTSYERGENYYRRGAIVRPMRQGHALSAFCIGTALYEVAIAFDESEVINAQCSCPYSYGGICKHGVALLLTWCREPELFVEIPTVRETLERRSKAELIELVEAMVTREPMLLSLVADSPLPTPDVLAPRIGAALQLPTIRAIVEALQPFLELAERDRQAENFLQAGQLYCALLSELTKSYDEERESLDYNSELCALASVLAARLQECLAGKDIPEALRRLWIGALVAAYSRNLDGGEYAYGVDAILLAIGSEQLAEVVASSSDRRMKGAISQLLKQKELQADEKTIAIADYPATIEKEINKRHRRYYRQAVLYLREYKAVCDEQTWLAYLASLRDRYGSLRSLWNEIEKANL